MRIDNEVSFGYGCKRAGKTSANFSPRSTDTTSKPPSVYLKTFGCQMNVRDSEVICGLLEKEGYKITDAPDKANIILFNTCSVRQHAEDKVWSEIGKYKSGVRRKESGVRKLQTPNSKLQTKPIIGLVGCMAQNYKEKIFERAPGVDFVVGPQDLDKIPEIIKELSKNGESLQKAGLTGKKGQSPKSGDSPFFLRKIWETDGSIRPDEIYHTGFYADNNHAFIVISEGCSNYCSYCVVPFVRGALRNRNYKEILKEIEGAVDKGITKITLLGQNVNAYKDNNVDFIKLIGLVNLIKGLEEFTFITSHPKDTTIDLFKAMEGLEKLKKYLHLPVQSGSDRILKLMHRGYTRKFYLDLADNYRKIVKDAILTTDIIAGFPTETEADFLDTYNLVKDIEFSAAYIFKYSPRPHTESEKLTDDVDKKEKERRHGIVLDLQKDISNKKKCLKR